MQLIFYIYNDGEFLGHEELSQETIIIGNGPNASIKIQAPQIHTSDMIISCTGDQVKMTDLVGPPGRVLCNGKEVKNSILLEDGDVLSIDTIRLEVTIKQSSSAVANKVSPESLGTESKSPEKTPTKASQSNRVQCVQCGNLISLTDSFCEHCGAEIDAQQSQPIVAPPAKSPPRKKWYLLGAGLLVFLFGYWAYDYNLPSRKIAREICECFLDEYEELSAEERKSGAYRPKCDGIDEEKYFKEYFDELTGMPVDNNSRKFAETLGSCLLSNSRIERYAQPSCDCAIENFDPENREKVAKSCKKEIKKLSEKGDPLSQMAAGLCMLGSKSVYARLLETPPEKSPTMLKAMRGELPINIKKIKTAQLQYESIHDSFVSCDEYPSRSGGSSKRSWSPPETSGFEILKWQPESDVRGSYSVTTTTNDFTIVGVIDVDGDGEYATYTATKSTNPISPTTDQDIY